MPEYIVSLINFITESLHKYSLWSTLGKLHSISNFAFCNIRVRRFKEGLKTLGVLECVQQHAHVMQAAFVNGAPTVDATMMKRLFNV